MSRRSPRLDNPSFDVDLHIKRPGKVKQLFDLLVERNRQRGDLDPDGSARVEVGRILADSFDRLAQVYSGKKKAVLDRLVKLQKQALDFYERAIAARGGKAVDTAELEKILGEMDHGFEELGRKAEDIAADVPAPPTKRGSQEIDTKRKVEAQDAKAAVEADIDATRKAIKETGQDVSSLEKEIRALKGKRKPASPALKSKLDELTSRARKRLEKAYADQPGPKEPLSEAELDIESRLEAVGELRAQGTHSQGDLDYLDWQNDLLTKRAELLDAQGGGGALGAKSKRQHEVELPTAEAELRAASRPVKELLRGDGHHYQEKSKLTFDEIFTDGLPYKEKQAAWDEFVATVEPPKADAPDVKPKLPLATDHLVPVDRIANMAELSEFLRLFEEAPESLKPEMTKAVVDLGDRPDNLFRMRADANGSALKGSRSWQDITYAEAAKFGYTAKHVDAMRVREAEVTKNIIKTITDMTDSYRKKIRGT